MFTIKVFEAVDRLELFPESGRVVPELNRKEIREVIIGNYRIIYRIREESDVGLIILIISIILAVGGVSIASSYSTRCVGWVEETKPNLRIRWNDGKFRKCFPFGQIDTSNMKRGFSVT